MKISKSQLRAIIKEELEKTINEVGPHSHGGEATIGAPAADVKKALQMVQDAKKTDPGNEKLSFLEKTLLGIIEKLMSGPTGQYNIAEE